MRLLQLAGLYLLLPILSFATPPEGVQFFTGSWEDLLKAARQQNKLIFVDVYTDWCGPCKRMDKEVFILPEVGKVYNALFINYKLNAEKGEGIQLAKEYAIKAYPTYLYIDADGNVVDRTGDYQEAANFIRSGQKAAALQDKMGNLGELEKRFRKGERDTAFLKSYLEKRTSLQLDNVDVLNAFVDALPAAQLKQKERLLFLSANMGSTVSKALPVLMQGLTTLDNSTRNTLAERLFNNLLYYALANAIKENKLKDAAALMANVKQLRPYLSEKRWATADNLELHYCTAASEVEGLKKVGYRIAAPQMKISEDSIKRKDKVLLDQVMEPFVTGKLDSTKIPDFEREKQLAAKQFSASIATTLFTVAKSFEKVLPASDKALRDALLWVERARQVFPNQPIEELMVALKKKIG